jgi:hypothetical protein
MKWTYHFVGGTLRATFTNGAQNDCVTVIYNMLGFGYLFHRYMTKSETYQLFPFRTVEAFIGEKTPSLDQALCCAQCLQRDAQVQCGHGCESAFYCGQECADAHFDMHEMACIEARAGRKGSKGGRGRRGGRQGKIHTVMDEFKRGELHSGSKHGPVVTNRKQAIAIALAEARRK